MGPGWAWAGWSHGGWAIMEALSAPREMAGEMLLRDPAAADLSGVKAVFLAYPYVGVAATGRFRPWRHCPKTLAVIAARDHLTTVRNAERVLDVACGHVEIERWTVDGTHAFDEPTGAGPMRHDQALTDEALKRVCGVSGGGAGRRGLRFMAPKSSFPALCRESILTWRSGLARTRPRVWIAGTSPAMTNGWVGLEFAPPSPPRLLIGAPPAEASARARRFR
ncbi:hypothetical protein [Brevundimonas denitrificans]|uniref:hypothetical protein n=1 Tax=Brevundimonas denitrificans TaxID=1443434 RepID=UPI00223BF205|nr:hypothetical protein [Brevundimonas denitrificans]